MGDEKPTKVKPATAKSVFNNVRTSNVSLPGFGSGTTTISGDSKNQTVNTTFAPDAQMQTILQGAKQGVQNNQSIFNLSPEQQFAQVEQNPYYQENRLQNQSFLRQGQADARSAASRSGLENSTIAGSIEASLLKDAALMDWQTRTGAIDYSRAIAAQNMGMNQDLLDQIYGFSQDPSQLSNQTLMNAGQSQDQVGMFNAQQQQQANMQNAQYQELARSRGIKAALGHTLGFLGGPIFGPLMGGAFGQTDSAMKGVGTGMNAVGMAIGAMRPGGGFVKK